MRGWSPEFEFVALLSRTTPHQSATARAEELARGRLDWDRAARLAEHHGVAALVDASLALLGERAAPEAWRKRIRTLRIESVSADLVRYEGWRQLNRAFGRRGIRAVTLKGFHTALSIYGSIGLRPVGDLDFLVARGDVEPALALLEEYGYPLWHVWSASMRNVGLDHILDATHEIGVMSARGLLVDLHWEVGAPGYNPPAAEVLACAQPFAADGDEMLAPPPGLALALLIIHGHKSAWSRLRWLVDVAEGLGQLNAPERAELLRWLNTPWRQSALAGALRLLTAVWGRDSDAGFAAMESGASERMVRYASASLERDWDWDVAHDFWRPARKLIDRVGRHPSLASALASAWQPNYYDWSAAALPRPLRFGYYVVRPLRIIGRALAARTRRRPPHPARAVQPLGPSPTVRPPEPAAKPAESRPVRLPENRVPKAAPTTPLTFVSAIYDSGLKSRLGGRGRGIEFYLPSLINIANLGAPIVMFGPQKDVREIEDAIAPYFCDYRVVPFELSQFEHFDAFLQWKDEYLPTLEINDRNEVLCFLKSYWVQEAIALNPFGHDRYYWIDSGLTHHGIFPESRGGVELLVSHPADRYYPRNSASIFTPALGTGFARAANRGTVTFCALPFSHGRRLDYERVAARRMERSASEVQIRDHLVGGIFGGLISSLRPVHALYADLLKEFIESRIYTLEEQVFSTLNEMHPELFSLRRFETWYFHAPGERTSQLAEEGDSFYKIFVALQDEGAAAP